VIHAVHSNNMSDMGGLRRFMPATYRTFLIGSLALAGIFPLAGFWSKDEILASLRYAGSAESGFSSVQGGAGLASFVLVVAVAGAFVTALYMARAVFLTFFGAYKGDGQPHESPTVMVYPLVGLATGAALVGGLNMAGLTRIFTDTVGVQYFAGFHALEHHADSLNLGLAAIGTLAALAGIALGYRLWFGDAATQQERDSFHVPLLYPLLRHKYFLDDIYMDGVIRPIRGPLARAVDWFNGHVIDLVINGAGFAARGLGKLVYGFDQRGVDAAINASAAVTSGTGGVLRLLQTGRVQQYAVLIFAGTVLLVAGLIVF